MTHYILNTKTGDTYDTNENRFYPASWEIEYEEKAVLEQLINDNPDQFENCLIIENL